MTCALLRHAPRLGPVVCCFALVVAVTACSATSTIDTGAGTTTASTAATSVTRGPAVTEVRATTTVGAPRPRLVPLFGQQHPLPLALHHVTRDGTDRYDLHQDANAIIVTAPATNRATPAGSATRAVIWAPESRAVRNATTCATWARSEPWAQEGLALRVQAEADRFRAIVIAKNTVYGTTWQFNVYSWDSARDPYFMIHGAVDLAAVFAQGSARPEPLPWRVCARTEGARVRIKGWDANAPQPGWWAAGSSATVDLPADLVYDGHAGWYGAHIEPGEILALADLRAYARGAPR